MGSASRAGVGLGLRGWGEGYVREASGLGSKEACGGLSFFIRPGSFGCVPLRTHVLCAPPFMESWWALDPPCPFPSVLSPGSQGQKGLLGVSDGFLPQLQE